MADQPGQPLKPSSGGDFKKALSKLASDAAYRNKATRDPNIITQDFKLSLAELEALRDAAEMSGADLSQVRKVRAQSFQQLSTQAPHATTDLRINISCCSCCCCCCGETAVSPMLHG
jgi:hypothetical protein